MTTKLKLIKLAILLILTAAIITACGDDSDTDNAPPEFDDIIHETQHLPNGEPINLMPNDEPINLTIFAPDIYTPLILAMEENMQEYFAEQGIDFSITITDYDTLDNATLIENNEILQTTLMSGGGYDIVFLNPEPLNVRLLADMGLLLNIYDLIDQDPTLTRNDFFTNVLSVLEHQGGLYKLPFNFGFDFIGINANLPDSIVDDFMQKSSISWRQAMRIIATLQTEYPEIHANFPYISNMQEFHHPNLMISRAGGNFIDFNNSESFFDGAEFIDFANLVQAAVPTTANLFDIFFDVILANFEWENNMQQMTERHILLGAARGSSSLGGGNRNFTPLIPIFGLANDAFLNFAPIADDNGNLLIEITPTVPQTWATVIFPAVGNGAIAWDFAMRTLQHMLLLEPLDPVNIGIVAGTADLTIPILRNELEPHFNRVIEEFSWWRSSPDYVILNGLNFQTSTMEEITANSAVGLARLTELANSPVASIDRSFTAWDSATVNSLMTGEISAEDFGQIMQERAVLWLAGD